jgi:hypothetical protein
MSMASRLSLSSFFERTSSLDLPPSAISARGKSLLRSF